MLTRSECYRVRGRRPPRIYTGAKRVDAAKYAAEGRHVSTQASEASFQWVFTRQFTRLFARQLCQWRTWEHTDRLPINSTKVSSLSALKRHIINILGTSNSLDLIYRVNAVCRPSPTTRSIPHQQGNLQFKLKLAARCVLKWTICFIMLMDLLLRHLMCDDWGTMLYACICVCWANVWFANVWFAQCRQDCFFVPLPRRADVHANFQRWSCDCTVWVTLCRH